MTQMHVLVTSKVSAIETKTYIHYMCMYEYKLHTHVCVCIHTCICMYICVCMYAYIHTCIHTYMYAGRHTWE